jgi:hypothetical protein
MTPFVDRFVELERRLATERGPFVLFALELRHTNLFGVEVENAYIITAKKKPTEQAVAYR